MSAPLLEAREARIVLGGRTTGPLTFTTEGRRLLLVGDTAALTSALAGQDTERWSGEARDLEIRGELRCFGHDVAQGKHRPRLGVASHAIPLPDTWTALDYLTWSARLTTGARRAQARDLGHRALADLRAETLAGTPCRQLSPSERRAVILAAATIGEPAALLLDRIDDDLDEAGRLYILGALRELSEHHAVIWATPRLTPWGLAGTLSRSADDLLVITAGELVCQASPATLAQSRLITLTITEGAAPLAAALAPQGLELRGGPRHFTVIAPDAPEPPSLVTRILRTAADVDAAVIHCAPIL
ncbi:MAG: hypothetical protein KC731_19270 [Myxococcales bacterium]|nr:hypothetical protein [Myxococcales bacterium]